MQVKESTACLVASALLIFLFVYAAFSQLINFPVFFGEINSQPLPNRMTAFLAIGIPAAELFISAGLIVEKYRLKSLWAAFLLLIVFTGYIVSILMHAFDRIPCSCAGLLPWLDWEQHFLFNLFFIIVALSGIVSGRANGKPIIHSLNLIV